MVMSDRDISALAQRITIGVKEKKVWKLLGTPYTMSITANVHEYCYQTTNWKLLIKIDRKSERITEVILLPLSKIEKAACEFRKRLEDIEAGTGQELPEPLQEGGAVEDEEYKVYSVLCSTSLFNFSMSGTTFDDLTRDEIMHYYMGEDRLLGDLTERVTRCSGLLDVFERKNARRARLEKRFQVPNGYQLLSEREQANPGHPGRYFILSRVGFSSDHQAALVYIEYEASCGYYVLLQSENEEHDRITWRMESHSLAWES